MKNARSSGVKDNSFAKAALELNVLDPAMGSGYFLVEATTHLAEEIASHPTTKPLSEKSKDEDEIAYWRRRVVESCIYGVDLNPLAVELAKLSLWLTTIAADQPLEFSRSSSLLRKFTHWRATRRSWPRSRTEKEKRRFQIYLETYRQPARSITKSSANSSQD